MRTWRSLAVVAAGLSVGLAAALGMAPQQRVTIKLATLAPDGSPWHRILKDMGHEWQRDTQGRVRLVIYPGGVAGDGRSMLRKIRLGALQGAALTVSGMSELDPAFNVFQIPLFFDSIDEFFYVLEQMSPLLKERLESRGFVVLQWGYGGWMHIFVKRPIQTVEELKRLKMFTGAGDDRMVRLWRSNGFRPVALSQTDIMMGLQSGMIDGIPVPPLAALATQWYKHTPYMIEPGVTPLVGATVVNAEAWAKISERDRAALLAAARRAEERLAAEIPAKDEESIVEMEERGLEVIRVRAGHQEDPWRATAESFARSMRTALVPDEVFDLAVRFRSDFRESRAGGG